MEFDITKLKTLPEQVLENTIKLNEEIAPESEEAIKLATEAKETADAVDGKATTALNNAIAAKSIADDAYALATEVTTKANTALEKAATAQMSSELAITAAERAERTADSVDAKATTALTTANTAANDVLQMNGRVTQLEVDVDAVGIKMIAVEGTAAAANKTAGDALTIANTANNTANNVAITANVANNKADANATDIANALEEIGYNTRDIATAEQNIAKNTGTIEAVNAQVDALDAVVNDLSGRVPEVFTLRGEVYGYEILQVVGDSIDEYRQKGYTGVEVTISIKNTSSSTRLYTSGYIDLTLMSMFGNFAMTSFNGSVMYTLICSCPSEGATPTCYRYNFGTDSVTRSLMDYGVYANGYSLRFTK